MFPGPQAPSTQLVTCRGLPPPGFALTVLPAGKAARPLLQVLSADHLPLSPSPDCLRGPLRLSSGPSHCLPGRAVLTISKWFFSVLIHCFAPSPPSLCGREDRGLVLERFLWRRRGGGGHSDPLQGKGPCPAVRCQGYGLPPALLGRQAWVAGAVLDILGIQAGRRACGSDLHKCKGRSYLCEFVEH